MGSTLIKNATIVSDGAVYSGSVLVNGDSISRIIPAGQPLPEATETIDASGKYLLPGAIDDHVHFRDPGLTHKADMATESRAAAAGGVTTIFDMPNTMPQTTTLQTILDKHRRAQECCMVNWAFYLGATRDNLDLVSSIDPSLVCGIKLFMGSSTGGMLLDDRDSLKALFNAVSLPIAAHCEETSIINAQMEKYTSIYGGEPPVTCHPLIRSEEACYASTSKALDMAAGTNARLHIMHISTARELALFGKGDLAGKQFTAEACPAHLWFTDADYQSLGTRIKCNPAIKTATDRQALREGLKNGQIDVIGTDHAPHLLSEKQGGCKSAASGMPCLPYSLVAMLELCDNGIMEMTDVVRLMCHNPAILFSVRNRGFIREGYKADLVLVSRTEKPVMVSADKLPNKCGWSPFEGTEFNWKVCTTWVNGNVVWDNGNFCQSAKGEKVEFDR